jgi:hypothetical protein
METLSRELEKLSKKGSLSKSIDDVQKTIDLLIKARESIDKSKCPHLSTFSPHPFVTDSLRLGPNATSVILAKLQNPVKQSFEKINEDLKETHSSIGKYQKALDKVSDHPLPTSTCLLTSEIEFQSHGFTNRL